MLRFGELRRWKKLKSGRLLILAALPSGGQQNIPALLRSLRWMD